VCGHLHLFDILLQYKAPIHTADIHSAFPIHYASQLSENEDLKIDSNKGRRIIRRIFVDFFKLGLAILQKFIDRKVDIDCIDGQKRTPFMWAASTG
jgi:ankyrin repeat protein